jgi:hypothetical protein
VVAAGRLLADFFDTNKNFGGIFFFHKKKASRAVAEMSSRLCRFEEINFNLFEVSFNYFGWQGQGQGQRSR